MYVILDTTELVADFSLDGVAIRTLLDNRERLSMTVHVPELVVLETVGKYRGRIQKAFDDTRKGLEDLKRYERVWRSSGADYQVSPDLSVEESADGYETHLRDALMRRGVKVVPPPTVDAREMMLRGIERKKPFNENGAGARDYLIWRTVLNIANADTLTYFVSRNKTDFKSTGSQALHEDLLGDLGEGHVVRYVESVNAFNAEHVVPGLERLDDVKARLQTDSLRWFSILTWFRNNIHALVDRAPIPPSLAGGALPYTYLRTRLLGVEIKTLNVEDVRRQPTGLLLAKITGNVILSFLLSEAVPDYGAPPPPESLVYNAEADIAVFLEIDPRLVDVEMFSRLNVHEQRDAAEQTRGSLLYVRHPGFKV